MWWDTIKRHLVKCLQSGSEGELRVMVGNGMGLKIHIHYKTLDVDWTSASSDTSGFVREASSAVNWAKEQIQEIRFVSVTFKFRDGVIRDATFRKAMATA